MARTRRITTMVISGQPANQDGRVVLRGPDRDRFNPPLSREASERIRRLEAMAITDRSRLRAILLD